MLEDGPDAHAPRPAARAPITARRAAARNSLRDAEFRAGRWMSRRSGMRLHVMDVVLRVFMLNLWWRLPQESHPDIATSGRCRPQIFLQ